MNTSIDLTAKLLATENLTVVRAPVKTASFNIQSRQLTLPILKNMTQEIEGMLVAHEISHALYTTMDMVEASKDNPRLHDYINVVEDVRVEKLVKRKYPGLKKSMIEGYKQLNERDFFGLSKIKNVNNLNLIDKINLWFKVGISSGVLFSPEETVFVKRIEKTETSSEVIQLANEIYEFSKNKIKQPQEEKDQKDDTNSDSEEESETVVEESEENNASSDESNDQTIESSDDQTTDESDESSSDQSSEESDDSKTPEEIDEELESKTNKSLNDNLDNYLDLNSEYVYLKLATNYDEDTIVSYKTILGETEINPRMVLKYGYTNETLDEEYNKFKNATLKTVNYLLKEFEMKKAATQYKRNKVSKSGSLDMKKLWGYQLNDDLFKRITTTQDGKKHGMIFLIDWSGSMYGVINDVIKQVITLSMFCTRAQIPFQVLAFSSYYYNGEVPAPYMIRRKDRIQLANTTENILNNTSSNCALLEFFNHKMSSKDFTDMAKRLFNTQNFMLKSEYMLGGTPLLPALAYMTDYVGKFIRQNSVEKMSFITLTDGQGESLSVKRSLYGSKMFLTDPITKINYPFSRDAVQQTDTVLKMIKDRYNVTNIGFYIAGSMGKNEIFFAGKSNGISNIDVDTTRKEVREKGFASFNTKGRDDLFIIPAKSLRIEDKELEISTAKSTNAIANKFTKMMEGRQVNRLLLNKFVSYIS